MNWVFGWLRLDADLNEWAVEGRGYYDQESADRDRHAPGYKLIIDHENWFVLLDTNYRKQFFFAWKEA